jgi:6-phosphogluconolactonase (cycloisomerase 2 family)
MKADPGARFLFASNFDDNTITAYSIDSTTGVLAEISGSPFSFPVGVGNGGPLAVDPKGRFLFYSDPSGQIGTFIINSNGSLTPSGGAIQQDGNEPVQMAADPSGHFLYVSNYSDSPGGDISAFSIDSTSGALTPLPGSPFTLAANSGTNGVAIHNSGKYLYASLNTGGIAAVSIDTSTGALTLVPGSPFDGGPWSPLRLIRQVGSFMQAGRVPEMSPGTVSTGAPAR